MDEYAKECFERLGVAEVPEKTAKLYRRVKSARDKLAPGRLDVDTIALVWALTAPDAPPPAPPTAPPRK